MENWKRELEDDGGDEVEEEYTPVTESVLYFIEANETMLSPDAHSGPAPSTAGAPSTTQRTKLNWSGKPARSKLELTLRCALAVMRRKIISSPKDKVGVIIYNTNETQSPDDMTQNIYVLQDLKRPSAKSIKELKDFLEEVEEDPSLLQTKFSPYLGQFNMVDALTCVSGMFRTKAAVAHMIKTLVLVTDNDNPVPREMARAVLSRRADLRESGYELQPILIDPSESKKFDVSIFWDSFVRFISDSNQQIQLEDAPSPEVSPDLDSALTAMHDAMRSKEAMKRSAFKLPFIFGEGMTIGVQGYALVGEEKKRLPIKYNPNAPEGFEVVRQTIQIDDSTGDAQELDSSLVRKYIGIGPESVDKPNLKIFFTEDEMRRLKTVGMKPCIKLLGFKPRKENLRFHETVKHSYFLQPNEDAYIGSRRTFIALLRSMVAKDVIGYAVMLARVSARPQICVLLAQKEELDETTGHQTKAPGIHVCQLPFADDMREIGLTSTLSAVVMPEEELGEDEDGPEQPAIDTAKEIVRRLVKTTYNPDVYPNPALNYHYETLAALALEEEIPDPVDKTEPLYAIVDERVGKYIAQLRTHIREDAFDPALVETSTKSRQTVKKEVTKGDPAEIQNFANDLQARGTTLKNDDLKEGLKLLGEKVSGTKQILYDRAVAALKREGMWDESAVDDEKDRKLKKEKKAKKLFRDERDD